MVLLRQSHHEGNQFSSDKCDSFPALRGLVPDINLSWFYPILSDLIRTHRFLVLSLPSFAQSAAVQVDALQLLHAVLHNVDATGGRRQRTPFRRNATDPRLSNFANFPLHGIMASNQRRCCDIILIEIVYYIHHYTSIYSIIYIYNIYIYIYNYIYIYILYLDCSCEIHGMPCA